MYSIRHSAFDLGLVGLVLFIPSLAFAPLSGVVADRFDRRAILALAALAEVAICFALIPLVPRHDPAALALTLGILAIAGISRAFAWPAEQSLLPTVVSVDRYVSASAASSAIREFVRIGGPALGGVLVAIAVPVAYLTVVAIGLVGAAAVVVVPLLTQAKRDAAPALRDALAGLHFILARPVVGGAITLDLFAVLFGGATALLPVYATQIFHVGAAGFGALRSAVAVGTVISALVLVRRPIRRHAGPRLLAAVACFGAATVMFGLSTSLWFAIQALVLVGAADMVSMAIRDALIALGTPDAMRGRVTAIEGVFIVASNELGAFESGFLAALIGAVPAVVAGGIATLVVTALWAWRNSPLRQADAVAQGERALTPTASG